MLDVRNVTRSYYTNAMRPLHVLRDVCFSLRAGEVAAVCGPSGSGKTTLLNIVGALDRPDYGEVWLCGKPLHRMGQHYCERVLRSEIGFVIQDFALLPALSAQENVELALLMEERSPVCRRVRSEAALGRVAMRDWKHHFPHELSAGQKQRVAIARALVKRPRLVIADEPTANLDSGNAFSLVSLIRSLAASSHIAFLIATHDQRLLAASSRRFLLTDGKLVERRRA